MIELTEKYRAAAKTYRKAFGYGVPLSMIPPTVETDDLIRQIEDCVERQTDDLLTHYDVEVHAEDLI